MQSHPYMAQHHLRNAVLTQRSYYSPQRVQITNIIIAVRNLGKLAQPFVQGRSSGEIIYFRAKHTFSLMET